jgi:hypothetical protein
VTAFDPRATSRELRWVNRTEVLAALRHLPDDLKNDLADASNEIAGDLVIGARARASTPQQRIAALHMRWEFKRAEPIVRAGGAADAGVSGGATVGELYFGAEFGGNDWRWAAPWLGQTGYMLYPEVRQSRDAQLGRYLDALDLALARADART